MKSSHQKLPVGILTSNSTKQIYSSTEKNQGMRAKSLASNVSFEKSDFLFQFYYCLLFIECLKKAFYLDTASIFF